MAVTNAFLNPAQANQDARVGERGLREARIMWLVETNDPEDGVDIVLRAAALPQLYAPYSHGNDDVDTGMTVRERNARRIPGERVLWEVEIIYSTRTETSEEGDENPLFRPPKMRWSTENYQKVATHDINAAPIMNTARDDFDPPPMMDDARLVMTYTRNEATNDIPFIFSYRNTVNEDTFFGFSPGEAKLTGLEAEREVDNGLVFWVTTYEFHFRKRITDPHAQIITPQGNAWQPLGFVPPWNITLLNIGYNEFVNNDHKRILGSDGKPLGQPVRLDQDGRKMAANEPRDETIYCSFEVYEAKPFSALGIV